MIMSFKHLPIYCLIIAVVINQFVFRNLSISKIMACLRNKSNLCG